MSSPPIGFGGIASPNHGSPYSYHRTPSSASSGNRNNNNNMNNNTNSPSSPSSNTNNNHHRPTTVPRIPMTGILAASRLRQQQQLQQQQQQPHAQQTNGTKINNSASPPSTTTTSTSNNPALASSQDDFLKKMASFDATLRSEPSLFTAAEAPTAAQSENRRSPVTAENLSANNNNDSNTTLTPSSASKVNPLTSVSGYDNTNNKSATNSNFSSPSTATGNASSSHNQQPNSAIRGSNNTNNSSSAHQSLANSIRRGELNSSVRRGGGLTNHNLYNPDSPLTTGRSGSQSFLSPRIEASVQLLQEGFTDVNDNEFENEIHQGAIAQHKQSLMESTTRRDQQKQKAQKTHAEMREELIRANEQIAELQKKVKASVVEKEILTKDLHSEKLKVTEVKEDLENANEHIADLKEENEKLEMQLNGLNDAVEQRARRRAVLRKQVQQMMISLEEKARENLASLEFEMRMEYTGGCTSCQTATDVFFASRGKEGPFWMSNGLNCFKMLLDHNNKNKIPLPKWLDDTVMNYRRERLNRHQSTQTIETAESRKRDQLNKEGLVEQLEQQLDELRKDLKDSKRESDRAKMDRDHAQNELDSLRQKEAALRRKLQEVGSEDDETRKHLEAELKAREAQELFLRKRIKELEDEIDRMRKDMERDRRAKADAVRAAVWIEQMFQLLEEEEKEKRRRILAQEADEIFRRFAPLSAALSHEAAKQRREDMRLRSHLRSLTPPRSMSGVTGKKPWYPPPNPGQKHQTLTQQQAFARMSSASPSPLRRTGSLVSFVQHLSNDKAMKKRSASATSSSPPSAYSRVNTAKLAVSVDQMRLLLDDLSKNYNPYTNTKNSKSDIPTSDDGTATPSGTEDSYCNQYHYQPTRKARTPPVTSSLRLQENQKQPPLSRNSSATSPHLVYSRQPSATRVMMMPQQQQQQHRENHRHHHPIPTTSSAAAMRRLQEEEQLIRESEDEDENDQMRMYHQSGSRRSSPSKKRSSEKNDDYYYRNDNDDDEIEEGQGHHFSPAPRRVTPSSSVSASRLTTRAETRRENDDNNNIVGQEEYYTSIHPRHQLPPRKASPPPVPKNRRRLGAQEGASVSSSRRRVNDNDDDEGKNYDIHDQEAKTSSRVGLQSTLNPSQYQQQQQQHRNNNNRHSNHHQYYEDGNDEDDHTIPPRRGSPGKSVVVSSKRNSQQQQQQKQHSHEDHFREYDREQQRKQQQQKHVPDAHLVATSSETEEEKLYNHDDHAQGGSGEGSRRKNTSSPPRDTSEQFHRKRTSYDYDFPSESEDMNDSFQQFKQYQSQQQPHNQPKDVYDDPSPRHRRR